LDDVIRRTEQKRTAKWSTVVLGAGAVIGTATGVALSYAPPGITDRLPSVASLAARFAPTKTGQPGATEATGTGGDVRHFCTVTDGDTIRCGWDRIRLAAIDAPEMPGHCRPGRQCTPGDPYASTANLKRLIGWGAVTLRVLDTDHYGRLVACVSAGGVDLSHAQVEGGFAVERYGSLSDC
jgi:endonuclease YncB( thermonuclease family)